MGVEIGLILIKFLRLLGHLLTAIIRLIAEFLRLIFKGIFYKILVKIYYALFRLKKNDWLGKGAQELIRGQSANLWLLALAAILIFANLFNPGKVGAMETQIPKTILAQLIPSGFEGLPNEQLIEETATPGSVLTAGQEKYPNNSCTLDKQVGLIPSANLEQNNWLVFNDAGDMILKPSIIATGGANGLASGPYVPQRTEIIYYTVQNGDTISTIARRFNLTVNTILWANNLNSLSLIRPGDSLTILPYSGVLYTVKNGDTIAKIASRYSVDANQILSCNDLSAGLKPGQKIIVPGAIRIVEAVVVKPTTNNYTGVSVIRDLVKAPVAQVSGNKMFWPTTSHTITQYFSWHHPGVDIANKMGAPVYAADAGTVIFAGWATGYGNSIVIDHGGGKKTRYGHSSKLLVSVGDEVEKGQEIMLIGSTGWSTGPHVHFEVIINGTRYNPLNYIR